MQYTIVIEKAANNYSAYVPDLPGCVTTGATIEQTKSNMQEAIAYHLRGMREDGEPIPEPQTIETTAPQLASAALGRISGLPVWRDRSPGR